MTWQWKNTKNKDGQVNKDAIRIPPFWNIEPELRFAQLEGQFILSGITQDSTKYSYVLSQLDSRQIREIKDVITQLPEANKKRQLKRRCYDNSYEDSENNENEVKLEDEENSSLYGESKISKKAWKLTTF